jgi:hypothetical protein
VLVSALRRNNLSIGCDRSNRKRIRRKVRDREDALAGTRDACAPQNGRQLQQLGVEINLSAGKHH